MPNSQEQAELQSLAKALIQAEKNSNTEVQIRLYKKLLNLTPDLALGHAQLAYLYLEQEDEVAALPHVYEALASPPNIKIDQMLFDHLSKIQHFIDDLPQARCWFKSTPNLWRFKLLYEALIKANEFGEAEETLHELLNSHMQPKDQAQLLSLLAQLYYTQARFHECIGCYRLGLELNPSEHTLVFNLAVALEQVGRYNEAIKNYQRVLILAPGHPSIHNNLALVMLRMGELEAGWRHYEWRWAETLKEHYQQFSIPRWQGEPLEDKKLLVWAEQGVGDHIMFASLIDDIRHLGGAVYYEVIDRLDALFRRSFPDIKFIRREHIGSENQGRKKLLKQSWPQSDYQIPYGSLPGLFRPSIESFPAKKKILFADKLQTLSYRTRYRELFVGKRLIGISWRGGNSVQNHMQSRRIALADLKILSSLPNIQLIDLQFGSTQGDLDEARQYGIDIFHDASVNPQLNLDLQAAQISALDAVVSIDNTTAHLAGALGTPTYILVPLNPNWRWGLKEGPTYWYGNAKVIRNRELVDWKEALLRTIEVLKADNII